MALTIGRTKSKKDIALTDEERSRHIHILGASGAGKSKLMESMIRADITAGRGLCLIDPHGTLAAPVLAWCAATGIDRHRRIHAIEPGDLAWCAGFNPLRLDGETETAVRVDAMVAACAQVWGGENPSSTPLLKKCLRAVFYTLAVRGLTLAEAPLLTNSESDQRRELISDLPDPVFDAVWRDFHALSRREFFEQFGSTNNRMLEFLSSPVVRRIVGQRDRVLDLKSVMDNSEIVIVNLASRGAVSPDNTRLLGTLLTSELFLQALRRDPETAKRRPFTLYIDECYDFLTADIERMLDQTRKFGLHLVLAHHRLSQLRNRSESIYSGVMAGGQTKIVFGGLMDDDAEVMAREVLRTSFDLERPKHVLDKPVVVDEVPFWLESETTSTSWSNTTTAGGSSGGGNTSGLSDGLTETFDLEGNVTGSSGFAGTGSSSADSWSESWSESVNSGGGRTTGRSQTLKPVRQMMPTAVYSLEEAQHLAIVRLRELPNQKAIVRRRGKPPVEIKTPFVGMPLASGPRIEQFLERTRVASPYLSATLDADAEITLRSEQFGNARELAAPASFWSEER